jgi:hypothetical protein
MTYDSTNLIATVDVRQLENVRLGIMRVIFPAFAEEIELGRYVRRLLRDGRYQSVHLEPHRDSGGRPSPHVFDVFALTSSDTPRRVQFA